MRVLQLSEFFPPTIGGIERHVVNLGRGLAARGHEVTVATVHQADLPEREVVEGLDVRRLRATSSRFDSAYADVGKRYVPPAPDPGLVRRLRALVHELDPDVIHAHNWMVHSFLPLKPTGRARLVVTLHDYSLVCAKKSLMRTDEALCSGPGVVKCLRCSGENYGRAKGTAIAIGNATMNVFERRLVDLFVPVSTAVADGVGLARRGLPFEVIPNFIPDDVASTASTGHPMLADLPERFLLYVGALGRHKGVQVLLEAYAALEDAPPLVLLGMPWRDMPTFPPGVVLLQNVPHAAVMEAMARSIALLVPSIYGDACPTVAMEAMASGRPVIASHIGGLTDIVADGETGIHVRPNDREALTAAMRRIVADEALADRLGAAGRERVALFSAGSVVDRIGAAYARVAREANAA